MSTQNKRTVTVFATKGKRKAKIETDASKWSELRELISQEGYDVNKLHATENVRRTDLAHEDAALPEGDFTVFLRPKKTKSGGTDYSNMGFKDLRAALSDDDKVAISEATGKNWTRCSTDDLRDYLSNKGGSPEPAATEEADEVTETNAIEAGDNNASRCVTINAILTQIKENTQSDEVSERVDVIFDELEALGEAVEAEDSPEAVAARKEGEAKAQADAEETEALAEEADDFMKGF